MSGTTYQRAKHAAHYAGCGGGHDLELWTVPSDTRTPAEARTFAGADLPRNADYHHGFTSHDGVQHWVFTRIAPLSGENCARCRLAHTV
jgi:hypothetical protein